MDKKALKQVKQKFTELEGEIGKSITIVRNLNSYPVNNR